MINTSKKADPALVEQTQERISSDLPGRLPPLTGNIQYTSVIEQIYYGRHRLVFRIGTYLALIRMMGIAHLVSALYGHMKLVTETHARLTRTRQTIVDLIRNGFDSPEGCKAVQRLRDAHNNLDATAEDYCYVLATFFLEPFRWNNQYGKKQLTQEEINEVLAFWRQVGQAMNIPNLPSTLLEWEQLQQYYEARYLKFSVEGHRLASMCLRDVVKLSLPYGTQSIFRQMMITTIDPTIRESLGIHELSWYIRVPVRMLLRII
ncbi:MAG: oxygenase MpaB family protein [Pseudomonadota bacterium]